MIGFVGTNGSGKTTTIRSILGFIKPNEGAAYVNGMESWKNQDKIAKLVGYVPGEIAFPDLKTGVNFLKSQAEYKNIKDLSYADSLIKELQLDPKANLKRMSKGMKQKTALVAALMADAPIIILDEPTTGLDPLMRDAFLNIIKREHQKGKTIFMSSHMFNEMEETCDRVALVSDGHIIDVADMNEIRNRKTSEFKIEFNDKESFEKFRNSKFKIIRIQEKYNQVTIQIDKNDINILFKDLKELNVKFISEVKYTLERHFKEIMEEKGNEKE
jgi:ABC-2 type transport system ATP-binding protein